MMPVQVDLQIAPGCTPPVPDLALFCHWANAALAGRGPTTLSIRVVDAEEMQTLNRDYRQKDAPTNVLSFPMEDMPDPSPYPLIGDIVLCAPVLAAEAHTQNRPWEAHWAHMVTHGCLHLLGYDHVEPAEAVIMESKEVAILAALGFPSPYGEVTK